MTQARYPTVQHDWTRYNRAIDRAAHPYRQPVAAGLLAGVAVAVLVWAHWPEAEPVAQVDAVPVVEPAVAPEVEPPVKPEPSPGPEPPMLRIHPDDLARLRVEAPMLRIHPDDLAALRVGQERTVTVGGMPPALDVEQRILSQRAADTQAAGAVQQRDGALRNWSHLEGPPAGAGPQVGGGRVVTNFSVFKRVALGRGTVITEWGYASSEATTPSFQYCSYAEQVGGSLRMVLVKSTFGEVAFDAQNPVGLSLEDWRHSAAFCQWFGGQLPR